MIGIPPAPRGMPVAWKGHCYGRVGSSLVALGGPRYEAIRTQSARLDWSAVPVAEGLAWADPQALAQGRRLYAKKHPGRADALAEWSDARFLGELRVMPQGQVTRAASRLALMSK